MRTIQINDSDSVERKSLATILLRNNMTFTEYSKKLIASHGDGKTFFTIRSRIERAVNIMRLSDLFSLVGYSLVVVPVGATVSVSDRGNTISETSRDKQALLFVGNEDGTGVEPHSLAVSPHWGTQQ